MAITYFRMIYFLIISFLWFSCTRQEPTTSTPLDTSTQDSRRRPSNSHQNKPPQPKPTDTQEDLDALENQIKKDWNIEDINGFSKRDFDGRTPLIACLDEYASEKDLENVEKKFSRLLKHPKINLWKGPQYHKTRTPLQVISSRIRKPNKESIDLLLNLIEEREGKEALIRYITYPGTQPGEFKQNDNGQSYSGEVYETALHTLASSHPDEACYLLDKLISSGGERAAVDAILLPKAGLHEHGNTVIHQAAYSGHLPLMKKLVQLVSKVKGQKAVEKVMNQENTGGLTPVFLAACSTEGGIPLMKSMMNNGGDITYRSKGKTNILHCVPRSGDSSKMEFLLNSLEEKIGQNQTRSYILEQGQSLYRKGPQKASPIESSIHWDSKDFTNKLIQKAGNDFNASLKQIRGMLDEAVKFRTESLALLLTKLVQKDGPISLQRYLTSYNRSGLNPLHEGIMSRNLKSLKILVQHVEKNNQQQALKSALKQKIKTSEYNRKEKIAGLSPLDLLSKKVISDILFFDTPEEKRKSQEKRTNIRQLFDPYV